MAAKKFLGGELMKTLGLAGSLLAALIVTAVLAGTAVAAPAERTVVHFPVDGPGGVDSHTCFWGVSYTQQTRNIIWPDSHTDYPVSIDTIPAGGRIVLHGEFPHARFFSLTTSSTLGVIRGVLYDDAIKPDPGSTNPFLPGADRQAKRRSYTVTIVDQPDPGVGKRETNVLYGGIAGQAPGAGPMLTVERVYLPDRGRDFSGGVGAPEASYVPADATPGSSTTGNAACAVLQTQSGADSLTDVNKVLFPVAKIDGLLAQSNSPTQPAVQPAAWLKYFTPGRLIAPYLVGTPMEGQIAGLPTVGTGLGANPANAYTMAWLDRSFGPNPDGHNIAVMRGTLPTTPATYAGEPKMAGKAQLRYWSMCNNEGLTSGKTTGPCLADEEVPIGPRRRYTIVVSLPEDRPANATLKCGVAWMDWGTTGDGYSRPRSTFMIMRNLSTNLDPSAFPQSVQNVTVPGTEKQVMGSYLPSITYTDKAQFKGGTCR
jgi:hypothetical protein